MRGEPAKVALPGGGQKAYTFLATLSSKLLGEAWNIIQILVGRSVMLEAEDDFFSVPSSVWAKVVLCCGFDQSDAFTFKQTSVTSIETGDRWAPVSLGEPGFLRAGRGDDG